MLASIPIHYILILSALLFSIGIVGVLIRRNAIVVFMCIELMLNSVNLTLIGFSHHHQNADGLILSFFIIALAAAEAVVGLAIILSMVKQKDTIEINKFHSLHS